MSASQRVAFVGLLSVATAMPAARAHAGFNVWGVQPATGNIIRIDPATGVIGDTFAAPGTLLVDDIHLGLTIAENDSVLLYYNGDDGPNVFTMYRLNPFDGQILSSHLATAFPTTEDGLSYQNELGQDRIFYSVRDDRIRRQEGYGLGDFPDPWETGAPHGGLGGDGHGREFGFFTDGFIHEYDPFVDDGVFTSTLPSPASDIEGMAFDGQFLYASTASGSLLTLNPDTGAVLDQVIVPGGALYGLGATVPGPAGLVLLALGGLALPRRRRAGRTIGSC